MLKLRAWTPRKVVLGVITSLPLVFLPKCLVCVWAYLAIGAGIGVTGRELCGSTGAGARSGLPRAVVYCLGAAVVVTLLITSLLYVRRRSRVGNCGEAQRSPTGTQRQETPRRVLGMFRWPIRMPARYSRFARADHCWRDAGT